MKSEHFQIPSEYGSKYGEFTVMCTFSYTLHYYCIEDKQVL